MIKTVYIDNFNSVFQDYNFESKRNNRELKFNKINLLVGANNSGKSRFLREFFKQIRKRELNGRFNNMDTPFITIHNALELFDPVFKSYLATITDKSNSEKENEYIKNHIERFKKPNHYSIEKQRVIEEVTDRKPSKFDDYLSYNEYIDIINDINLAKGGASEIVRPHNDLFTKIHNEEKEKLKNFCYSTYIPILRTLKKVSTSDDLFKKRIHADYFSPDFSDIAQSNIFTGEDLFSIINKLKNSTERKERQILKDFEQFIKDNFFNNEFEILALDNKGKKENGELIKNEFEDLSILIGDEERRIPFFGDGIQSLIILTFPLFLNRNKNHVLFIDEPELNLHPGLQRLFFETLNHVDFKDTQIFISTHSNHFLNIATEFKENISVFSFTKNSDDNKFYIKDISQRASEALDLLGVCNSSVFLSNCTIWVEGISDRIHLKKYLEVYSNEFKKKKFNEDYHFAFIEYGGINLRHWSFFEAKDETDEKMTFEAISNNVFLLVDNDNKDEHHKKMKEKLGELYNYLNCLEIENLLKPEILKKVLFEYRDKRKTIDYENFELGKKEISYNDYLKHPIGNFIHNLISDNEQMSKSFLSKVSETKYAIDQKRKFNEIAMKKIEHWSDLSDEAQNLTERIYEFIENNNK